MLNSPDLNIVMVQVPLQTPPIQSRESVFPKSTW